MHIVYMVGQRTHEVPPYPDTEVQFEVDTGCSVTVLNKKPCVKLGGLAVMPTLETHPI